MKIPNNITARPRPAVILGLVILAVVFGACNPFGGDGGPTPAGAVVRTPQVRQPITPVPTPTPTAATPTPTSAPNLTSADVQRLVFQTVSQCADQISLGGGTPVKVQISVIYNVEEERWESEVIGDNGSLNFSFGRWQVLDDTREVTPLDSVAADITIPNISCGNPVAFLGRGATPPLFLAPTLTPTLTPTPTPTVTPTPTPIPTPTSPIPTPTSTPFPPPLVGTIDEAQLRVWATVFDCFGHFPSLESFAAYQDTPERWVVEGKSTITHYGLWLVDAFTGEIIPADSIARETTETCVMLARASSQAVITGQQAALLVWVASYDCFEDPKPTTTSFTSFQDTPQRWLVEGRDSIIVEVEVEKVVGDTTETSIEERIETALYGLWLVDTNTAAITPWDQLARFTSLRPCYQTS